MYLLLQATVNIQSHYFLCNSCDRDELLQDTGLGSEHQRADLLNPADVYSGHAIYPV